MLSNLCFRIHRTGRNGNFFFATSGHRGEAAFHDDPAQRRLGGEVHGHGGAERLAVDHDAIRVDAAGRREPLVGRACVAIDALLARRAAALAVATIVDDQGVRADVPEHRELVQPMRNVTPVAVEEKHHGRIGSAGRDPPAVERLAVRGLRGSRPRTVAPHPRATGRCRASDSTPTVARTSEGRGTGHEERDEGKGGSQGSASGDRIVALVRWT